MSRGPFLPTRRRLLTGMAAAAAAAGLGVPPPGRSAAPNHHKFVMFWATGGWDVTKLYWPPSELTNCDPERDWSEREAHGIRFVDHPLRPRVRSFFEQYGDVTCLVNGLLVRSVNHRICARLLLTGQSTRGNADWPSIIGADAATRHALPSVVVSGYTSPGPLSQHTSLVGREGQMQSLLDRGIFAMGTEPVAPPPDRVLAEVDELLARRVARQMKLEPPAPAMRMLEVLDNSLRSLRLLNTQADDVAFTSGTLEAQIRTGVSLLEEGVSRCVTIGEGGFLLDMHSAVDDQDPEVNQIFAGLSSLVEALRAAPGSGGGTLADETTIVLASEMGRTPWRNVKDGRDHWPYTSFLLIGAGVRGGRMVGGFDDLLDGLAIDTLSGDPRPDGLVLTPGNLGATLLHLAGIDPELWTPGFEPIHAALT